MQGEWIHILDQDIPYMFFKSKGLRSCYTKRAKICLVNDGEKRVYDKVLDFDYGKKSIMQTSKAWKFLRMTGKLQR